MWRIAVCPRCGFHLGWSVFTYLLNTAITKQKNFLRCDCHYIAYFVIDHCVSKINLCLITSSSSSSLFTTSSYSRHFAKLFLLLNMFSLSPFSTPGLKLIFLSLKLFNMHPAFIYFFSFHKCFVPVNFLYYFPHKLLVTPEQYVNLATEHSS